MLNNELLEKISKVKKFLDDNFCNCPRIYEIADMFDYDLRTLQNTFRLVYGCTIKEYIEKKRFEKLIELLRDPDNKNMSSFFFAVELGYKNESGLYNLVKKMTNMTFLKFRESVYDGSFALP